MVYTKDSPGFPDVGRYAVIRFIKDGRKGQWLEPMCSITSFVNNPEVELVKYDEPGEQLPE